MKILKGTIIKVHHRRKGIFKGKAIKDFETNDIEFYPIELLDEKLEGLNNTYYKGEVIECRNIFCKLEIVSDPNE